MTEKTNAVDRNLRWPGKCERLRALTVGLEGEARGNLASTRTMADEDKSDGNQRMALAPVDANVQPAVHHGSDGLFKYAQVLMCSRCLLSNAHRTTIQHSTPWSLSRHSGNAQKAAGETNRFANHALRFSFSCHCHFFQ